LELIGFGGSYRFDEEAIHQKILSSGFKAYQYAPLDLKLELRKERSHHGNTIYIKDFYIAIERSKTIRRYGSDSLIILIPN
jgi:hypothetical protein